jgi:hypothetical protein
MLSGVLTQESMVEVLRSISQRRRQGTLEIRYAERAMRILFVQGKIAEVLEQGVNPAQELLRRFRAASICPAGFSSDAQDYAGLWRNIEADPICQNRLSRKEYCEAIKHRVLDKLYAMDLATEAFFEFSTTHFEVDKTYLPNISVGQLLLDFVAIKEERERFINIFGANPQVQSAEMDTVGLSSDEQRLLELSAQPISVQKLKDCSLLSVLALEEALLHLHEEGAVQILHDKPVLSSSEFLDDKLLDGLDASIDQAFAEDHLLDKVRNFAAPQTSQIEAETLRLVTGTEVLSGRRPGAWRQRLSQASLKMAANPWVPAASMLLFLAACLLLPFYFWGALAAAF